MNIKILLSLSASITLLAAGQALAAVCPPARESVVVQIDPEYGRIRYNHRNSAAQMETLNQQIEGRTRRRPPQEYPNGLTVARNIYSLTLKVMAKPHDGGFCVYPTELTGRIGYEHLTIFIDKKYSPESCPYNVILEHENQHVKIYRQVLYKHMVPMINEAIRNVSRLRPVFIQASSREELNRKVQQAASAMNERLINMPRPAYDRFNYEKVYYNSLLDTPENYRRQTERCDKNEW